METRRHRLLLTLQIMVQLASLNHVTHGSFRRNGKLEINCLQIQCFIKETISSPPTLYSSAWFDDWRWSSKSGKACRQNGSWPDGSCSGHAYSPNNNSPFSISRDGCAHSIRRWRTLHLWSAGAGNRAKTSWTGGAARSMDWLIGQSRGDWEASLQRGGTGSEFRRTGRCMGGKFCV